MEIGRILEFASLSESDSEAERAGGKAIDFDQALRPPAIRFDDEIQGGDLTRYRGIPKRIMVEG